MQTVKASNTGLGTHEGFTIHVPDRHTCTKLLLRRLNTTKLLLAVDYTFERTSDEFGSATSI